MIKALNQANHVYSVYFIYSLLYLIHFLSFRAEEKLYDVLEAEGGGFWRDMEQIINDNQGCCDARLRGESHVEWPVLVSDASMLKLKCDIKAGNHWEHFALNINTHYMLINL